MEYWPDIGTVKAATNAETRQVSQFRGEYSGSASTAPKLRISAKHCYHPKFTPVLFYGYATTIMLILFNIPMLEPLHCLYNILSFPSVRNYYIKKLPKLNIY